MNNTLKPLPAAPTKNQVYQMYNELSYMEVRQVIHLAIQNCNDPARNKSKYSKSLTPKEFKFVIEELGTPKGYHESLSPSPK